LWRADNAFRKGFLFSSIAHNNPLNNKQMTEFSNKEVVNDVATEKKKYVKPEIEAFYLDNQAPLLAASPFGAGFQNIDDEDL
jgi:hypothetical protein